VKVFAIPLLSIIFLVLLSGSIKSAATDFLESDTGIFFDEVTSNIELKDSKYQVYAQITHRNEDGQLISVIESSLSGAYTPHKITDDVFDTLMGKKEIVTIDDIKYEKVQYTFSPTLKQRWMGIYPIFDEIHIEYVVEGDALVQMKEDIMDHYRWVIHYCAIFKGHEYTCIPVFQSFTVIELVTHTDTVTHQWTILRVQN
jgi:hypothetical protein